MQELLTKLAEAEALAQQLEAPSVGKPPAAGVTPVKQHPGLASSASGYNSPAHAMRSRPAVAVLKSAGLDNTAVLAATQVRAPDRAA